jgi:hypothetical protein
MEKKQTQQPRRRMAYQWLILAGILAVVLCCGVYAGISLGYSETKGPFKNWTQVVDLEGDGDLDVVISHTRWESEDISWAGIGRWINLGNGVFELARETSAESFAGFAAGAGDVDQDGDTDIFVQEGGIRLLVNQGGLQAGKAGEFLSRGGINSPLTYNEGYRDTGGTITTADLNGDGLVDAYVAGCCYGTNPTKPGYSVPMAPSASWVWINDGLANNLQTGHITPMESLDGITIRQVVPGDLDGDGDLDLFAAVGQPTLGSTRSMVDLVLLNDGTGRLVVFDPQMGSMDSTSAAVGDVNRDGRLDILVGTNSGARLWINQGNETGDGSLSFVQLKQNFEAAQTASQLLMAKFSAAVDQRLGLYLPYGSTRTKAVFLADLDGDDDLDAVLARVWGAETWLNDGLGEFRRSDVRLNYIEDTGVALGDFDGDSDQDIFSGRNGPDYQVWWNNGQGEFNTDQ